MLIDLGDVTDADALAPRARRRPGSLTVRQWIGATVAILVALLCVTASERASVGPLAFVGSIPIGSDAQLLVSGAQAVVLDATPTSATISGFALPGGRHQWSAPLTVPDTGTGMFVTGHTLVVDEQEPLQLTRGQAVVEGFDLSTGRRLWRYASDRIWPTTAGLVIAVETSPFPDTGLPDTGPGPFAMSLIGVPEPTSDSVALIDPATGRVRWSVPMADGCDVTPVDAGETLPIRAFVEMCPDTQELIGIDLVTGKTSARRQVDLAGITSPYVETIRPEMLFAGTVTVVAIQDSANIVLSAFRTSDFTPLWSGYVVGAAVQVAACGADLCIDDGSGTEAAVDPSTGIKVAHPPPAQVQDCCRTSISLIASFGLNEIVVVPPGQTPIAEPHPVTVDFEPTAVAGQAVTTDSWTSDVGDNLWIAEQVSYGRSASVRPLGVLHGVGESCVVAQSDALHRYLACTTAVDRLSMWLLG